MTVTPDEEYTSVYGVTPDDVMQLVKTTTLAPTETTDDPYKRSGRKAQVQDADVREFIRSVEGEVTAHLAKVGPDHPAHGNVAGLARTATLNGAAHYTVVAAHPAAAATNDASSHAATLWTRYRALLDALDVAVEEIARDPDLGGDPATGYVTGPSRGSFNRPRYFGGLEV